MITGLYGRGRLKSYWGSYGEIQGLLKRGIFSILCPQCMCISEHNFGSRDPGVFFFSASSSDISTSPNTVVLLNRFHQTYI